jgi:hypothetical protein
MPGKKISVSLVLTTCTTLSPAPSDDRGAFTSSVSTHQPQVRFAYHYEDTPWSARLASRFGFATAQYLDGRAGEYGVLEPDVRLGDLHLHGFDRGMFV